MNLYECLGVWLCPNATVSGGGWIYQVDSFSAVICEQVGVGWAGKQD